MRKIALLMLLAAATPARAADINRKLIVELDPISPATAVYDEKVTGFTSSKWGASADFNLAGVLSTGPEYWTGNFVVKGPEEGNTDYRREDFWPGERQKLDAARLRWNVTAWEQASSMRGWYLKAGYSYMRINSRANRYTEGGDAGDAVPVIIPGVTPAPDDETDLVTDIRHGGIVGFGNRWLVADQKVSITVGLSATAVFKRTVTVDSKDPDARKDYDTLIEDIPDARMTTRPTPEANLGVGYAF